MKKLYVAVALLAFASVGFGFAYAQHQRPGGGQTPGHQSPPQAQPRDGQTARPRPPAAPRPPERVVVVPEAPWPWWGYPYPPYGVPVYADWETADVRVDVTPDSAQVYVDGYYAGIVDDFNGIFHHLTLRAGPHLIEVRKEGYTSLAVELNLSPGQTVTYRRTMEPSHGETAEAPAVASVPGFEEGAALPPPAIAGPPGDIRFEVTPKNAEVFADGFYAGIVDDFNGSQHLQLAPGKHHLVVTLDGYETVEVDVAIESGRSITYRATLKKP